MESAAIVTDTGVFVTTLCQRKYHLDMLRQCYTSVYKGKVFLTAIDSGSSFTLPGLIGSLDTKRIILFVMQYRKCSHCHRCF
jgi:hypothetical protein